LNLCDRSSGQAPDAPKHLRARPIHLSSLYEILFRPESNRIAPLTNIAVPAAELTGKPRTGAACRVCIKLFELAPTPTENNPKTPQPNKNVPMASLNFTRTPIAQKRPD